MADAQTGTVTLIQRFELCSALPVAPEEAVAHGADTSGASAVHHAATSLSSPSIPHLHSVFLDGAHHEQDGGALAFEQLDHLRTRDVGHVLEAAVRRIDRYLRRRGLLELGAADDDALEPEAALAASAVSGQQPPAGPQWLRGLSPLSPSALVFDKPLCASLDGFTLHAATRAGALDAAGREALLRHVLRPPVAQERVELLDDGLVRIALERAYADGMRWREVATSPEDVARLLARHGHAARAPPPRCPRAPRGQLKLDFGAPL